MKNYLSTLILLMATASISKSQTSVTTKEVVNYLGKTVTLCDSVYSARALDNISLLTSAASFQKKSSPWLSLRTTEQSSRKSR